MSVALYALRCVQLGIGLGDLEHLTVGLVFDMLTESKNDDYNWPVIMPQSFYDNF